MGVADVLASKPLRPLNATVEEVLQAVRTNAKQRFDVRKDSGAWYIRAVQGHSMKGVDDASLLTQLHSDDDELPNKCIHGTYKRHLASILQQGLLVGGGTSD